MLTNHRDLTLLPDETVIWRYMGFDRFASMLHNSGLWFTLPSVFEDEHEGWYPAIQVPDSSFSTDEEREILTRNMAGITDRQRRTTYVNCWHLNPRESVLMWKAYTPNGQGVAVKTTVGRLRAAMEGTRESIFHGKVEYRDYDDGGVARRGNSFAAFCIKRPEFETEREFRLLFLAHDRYDIPNSRRAVNILPRGLMVQVDLVRLIEEVVISPNCDRQWRPLVEPLLTSHGIPTEILSPSVVDRPHTDAESIPLIDAREELIDAIECVQDIVRNHGSLNSDVMALLVQLLQQFSKSVRDQSTTPKRGHLQIAERTREAVYSVLRELNQHLP